MSTTRAATSRVLARQLLESETALATDATRLTEAMQRVCLRVSNNLRRSVGEDGYGALLARAIANAEHDPRMLRDIWSGDASGTHLHLATAIEHQGAATVDAALEALLAALADTLSDLVGVELTRLLLEYRESSPSRTGRIAL